MVKPHICACLLASTKGAEESRPPHPHNPPPAQQPAGHIYILLYSPAPWSMVLRITIKIVASVRLSI